MLLAHKQLPATVSTHRRSTLAHTSHSSCLNSPWRQCPVYLPSVSSTQRHLVLFTSATGDERSQTSTQSGSQIAQSPIPVVSDSHNSSDATPAVEPSSALAPAASLEQASLTTPSATGSAPSGNESLSSQSVDGDSLPGKKKGNSSFTNRVIFGTILGLGGGAIVLAGNIPFLVALIYVTYQATQEYYGFITSKSMTAGMAPPPPVVSVTTTILCTSIALLAFFSQGRSGTILAVAAFLLLVLQVITVRRPKFSQLASSLFGLFYCGWLPSFWVKLRCISAAAPTIPYTGWISSFSSWTVGLLATFTTVACVIAADTGAYFVGKAMGRTKLTDISPKKTVEGAVGGLASSVAVAVGLSHVTHWPATPIAAAGLGALVFFSSLFGDLIESIMKRDAGMKDSGNLIPGHGGLLDRIDSYMFTGAVTYFYCVFMIPNFGVALPPVPV